MSKSDAGKGDTPRPFDHKKWDAWWDQYEKGKKDVKEDDVHSGEETGDAGRTILHSRQRRNFVQNPVKIMGMDCVFKSRLDDA